jgi:DNA-binding SARP family transcriptional activator
MTTRHPRPLRSSAAVPRLRQRIGAAGLLALVVLVPPALLLALAGSPLDPPAALRSRDAVTGSVDDTSLLWLLSTAAWLLYAHLLATLMVEAARQTRGSTLRLPLPGLLFGVNAALASHLIASLVLTSASQHTTGLTPALVRTAVIAPAATGPAPTPAPDLQQHRQLARPTTTTTGSPAHAAAGLVECRVLPPEGRDHDTLWDIAERHLGDGTRWRDIFALNDGRLMPDGQRLTRASLIYPGWVLTLPADAVALEIDRVPPRPATPSAGHAPAALLPTATPESAKTDAAHHATHDGLSDPRPAAPPAGQHTESPQRTTPTPTVRSSDDAAPAAAPAQEHDELPAGLGLGTLMLGAVGLLAALTRRRKVAARRRPPGVRATRPSDDLLATERELRAQARLAEDTAATVRLAMALASRQAPHAQLRVLWQHPDDSLELIWADPAPAAPVPAPFIATDRGWLLPADAHPMLFATRSVDPPQPAPDGDTAQPDAPVADAAEPFPLLMPVGSRQGSACLVNLELYGLICLNHNQQPEQPEPAPPTLADVLAAWVSSLAAAPWTGPLRICLPRRLEELATGLDAVHVCDQVPPFRSDLTPDELQQARTHANFSTARRHEANLDSLGFELFVGYHAGELPSALLHAATDPAQPTVVLLAESHPDGHAWTLHHDGRLSIPGVADDLTPLTLDPDTRGRVCRLLEHAQDPPQAPPDDTHRTALRTQCPPAQPAQLQPVAADTSDEPVLDLTSYDNTDTSTAPATQNTQPDGFHEDRPPAQAEGPRATPKVVPPADDAEDEEILRPIEVCVLGPVTVRGIDRPLPRQQALDLLTYLCFHRRPLRSEELWEAVWPGKPYNNHTLRNRIHDLRTFIKPLLHRRPGGGYELDELVLTDWQRFQGLADGTPDQQLAALALVRGRPFPRNDLDWFHLEGQQSEIEASIVDLALQVGEQALRDHQYDTARIAALAGLRACPWEERLYRIAMRSAAARGATAEVHQLRRQLNSVLDDELAPDDDLQPATSRLMQELRDEERQHQLHQRNP